MEPSSSVPIRDFRIRGNYFNQRSLLSRKDLHYSKKAPAIPSRAGYSPPEIDIHFENGHTATVAVSEADIPLLCGTDPDAGNRYLELILKAREGGRSARNELMAAAQNNPLLAKIHRDAPTETEFVVPCTSAEKHSDEEISQKGSILLKLSQEGYPVPDFVVMTAKAFVDRDNYLEQHCEAAIQQLEQLTIQNLGARRDPLVFAIRCGTPRYIPGVMDTYLNVGITEDTLPALIELYGPAVAHRMFLNNLSNLYRLLELGDEEPIVPATRTLDLDRITELIGRYLEKIRKIDASLVNDSIRQAHFFVRQAYEEFEENRELVLTLCRGAQYYPSLILQKMVCSIRTELSYAGVLCSRNTQTGKGVELQTAHDIFGEEIMTGTAEVETTEFDSRTEVAERFPGVYHFVPHLCDLEREFESPVTIEFAVESTERFQWFALLQLNETGMAGRAALAAAIDMHKAGTISRKRVTELIRPYHIKQLSSDSIDEDSFKFLNAFCSGVAVLPRSAVSARIYFSSESALNAKSRGEKVCLCKSTFVPTDTVVMREMDAIISLTSVAIHVVTICQSLGIPAVLSIEKNGVQLEGDKLRNSWAREIKEGDWVTISSRRRLIYEGQAKYKPARLLRYMHGEDVEFAPGERATFDAIAYNYRYYQQLIKGLTVDQISTLDEITRLVNVELRENLDEARALVNSWFDEREGLYVEEVFKSDIGDHLVQSRVFDQLTLDRKTRFFKLAIAKCLKERISGYGAGAFMLGRFLSTRYPVAFWKMFSCPEVALLINEWVLFEKYMQLLHNMGERKLLQARKKILEEGLDSLRLHPGNVKCLITAKLAGVVSDDSEGVTQDWADPQSRKVIELLRRPYRDFYDFETRWSVAELEKICREENLPVPQPDAV